MASSYKARRCSTCGGNVEYIPIRKVWRCVYCYNEYDREEEFDGLYKIKNVIKQVLTHLAYGRMELAERDLMECEKIDSEYVGTLIAGICTKFFSLIIPGACRDSEKQGIWGQIERLYSKLKSFDDSAALSVEEVILYDDLAENGDALGVLLLVFDTLQAQLHLDFVLKIFDASTVYSKSLNSYLLNYALRNNKIEIADKIFMNSDYLHCRDALFLLLTFYIDSEQKRRYIDLLVPKTEFFIDDYKIVKEYIVESLDCADTKIVLYVNAVEYGAAPSMRCVADHILNAGNLSQKQIAQVYQAFCRTKPKDAELYELITEIYAGHGGVTANFEMQELLNSHLYMKLTDKIVRNMINRQDLLPEERIGLLEKAEKCRLDRKANDIILSEVLLHNTESTEVRLKLVQKMTEYVNTVSPHTFTEYVIFCDLDGERKEEMLKILLKLNLNMSFFRDVPGKYIRMSKDTNTTKGKIARLLVEYGLSVDGELLLEIACSAQESDYLEKAEFIKKSIQNGTRIAAEYLNIYLERVSPQYYHREIFSLLSTPSSRVSDRALENYFLHSAENFEIKLQNTLVFSEKNGKPFGESVCEIHHLGSHIRCNLFQGYVLSTEDSIDMADKVMNAMKYAKAKLNPMMDVNGQGVKFKKYVVENKKRLSPVTVQLCEQNQVFSFFF